MKALLVTTSVAVSALAGAAAAQEWYGEANVGVTLRGRIEATGNDATGKVTRTDPDTESSAMASLGMGRSLRGPLTASLDADPADMAITYGTATKATQSTVGGLISLRYDHDTGTAWSPYVSLGLGYGKSEYERAGHTNSDTGVMYQVRWGVGYKVSDRFTLDAGYRLIRAPELTVKTASRDLKVKTDIEAFTVGGRYSLQP